jgi:hypothetical protein
MITDGCRRINSGAGRLICPLDTHREEKQQVFRRDATGWLLSPSPFLSVWRGSREPLDVDLIAEWAAFGELVDPAHAAVGNWFGLPSAVTTNMWHREFARGRSNHR